MTWNHQRSDVSAATMITMKCVDILLCRPDSVDPILIGLWYPEKTGLQCQIPGLGRSPGEGNGNLLQYSCLENPWTEEPGYGPQGCKELDTTDHRHTHTHVKLPEPISTFLLGIDSNGPWILLLVPNLSSCSTDLQGALCRIHHRWQTSHIHWPSSFWLPSVQWPHGHSLSSPWATTGPHFCFLVLLRWPMTRYDP